MLSQEVLRKRKLIERTAEELSGLGLIDEEEASEVSAFAEGLSPDKMLNLLRVIRNPPSVGPYNISKEGSPETLERLTRNEKITCSQIGQAIVFFKYSHQASDAVGLIVDRISDPENYKQIFDIADISEHSSCRKEIKAMLSVYFGEDFSKSKSKFKEIDQLKASIPLAIPFRKHVVLLIVTGLSMFSMGIGLGIIFF